MATDKKDNKGFFESIGDFFDNLGEFVHREPMQTVEDIFALIGLLTVTGNRRTIIGWMKEVVAVVLRGGLIIGDWTTARFNAIRNDLHNWEPFQRAQHDPMLTAAARRILDYWHLYRWLIILGLAGLLVSVTTWFVTISSVGGFLVLTALLVGLFIWSFLARLAHLLVAPLICTFFYGLFICILSIAAPSVINPWLTVMGLVFFAFSVVVIALTFWPIYVLAVWIAGIGQKDAPRPSLFRYMSLLAFFSVFPLAVFAATLVFNAWSQPITFILFLLGLAILGLIGFYSKRTLKLVGTIITLGVLAIIVVAAYLLIVPEKWHKPTSYKLEKIAHNSFGSPKLYWDVNQNGMPDQDDLDYLSAGLKDKSIFPQANIRYADVNGDGKSDSKDIAYFKRFMEGKGPEPVKVGLVSSANKADTKVIIQPTVSPSAREFFDLKFEEMEITNAFTKVIVSWSHPRSAGENASVALNTVIADDQGFQYRLMSTKGVVPLGGKAKLDYGQKITAELYFPPLQKNVKTARVCLYDLWNNGPFIFIVHCNT